MEVDFSYWDVEVRHMIFSLPSSLVIDPFCILNPFSACFDIVIKVSGLVCVSKNWDILKVQIDSLFWLKFDLWCTP